MERKKRNVPASCASCDIDMPERICMHEGGKASPGCPTAKMRDVLEQANKEYTKAEIKEFARQASIQEGECYANRHERPYVMQPTKTRIEEICEFAGKMKYKRLGLAFCTGLATEAAVVDEILRSRGFEVVSVVCKAGKSSKDMIGIKEEEKIFQETDESMCNPVYQAQLLNHEKVDFNILLGLCVGHDSLFFRYAEAPVTVLAAKDRVTGHNPLVPIYLSGSYYRKIKAFKKGGGSGTGLNKGK